MTENPAHDLSGGGQVLAQVTQVARNAFTQYEIADSSHLELINVSENAIFKITEPNGVSSILRVHRYGYHGLASIESELTWAEALRADLGLSTPRVLPSVEGRRVVEAAAAGEKPRHCVRFEFVQGSQPSGAALATSFSELGTLTARLHRHARGWSVPAGFTRFAWDYDAAFGTQARWGRWQNGIGVGRQETGVLARLDEAIGSRLVAFGRSQQRYGLIHADLRLANLLACPDRPVTVIDFDDCGFGWYLYDLGAALSFMEHEPQVPELIDCWIAGYRKVAALTVTEEREIWTFIMFRRLLLLAWIGSHSVATEATELGDTYTQGTCLLAEQYLSTLK